MKKILLILIITIAVIVKLELKEINADSTATNMGFTVPTDWGIYKDTHTNSEYIYKEYNGIVYIVAETEVQSAVYELNSDDNCIAVIYETTLDPWDVNVRINFWLSRLYKHESRQITAFSDVDSSYYPVYQGAYYHSGGFTLQDYNNTYYPINIFSGSAEITGDPIVDDEGDISITNNVDLAQEYFEMLYEYNCTYSCNSQYDNISTNQIGGYIINKNDQYVGNVGSFVNELRVNFQVVYTSGIGIYPDVEYSSTNYY